MGLLCSGTTNIGKIRKSNQDSIYINRKKHLYIVADGMGGHNGGDIASAMAVKIIPEYILEHFEDFDDNDSGTLNQAAVARANKVIKAKALTDEQLRGMGTTVISMIFRGDTLYLVNVGDSRGYLISKQKIYQLSKDHSLVQEKVNMGIYTRNDAAQDPMKNVLTRTVGFDDDVEIDLFNYKVAKYDIFLSCSDGLHGLVAEADILFIINKHLSDPSTIQQKNLDAAVSELISQANENGGNDNISVILIFAK